MVKILRVQRSTAFNMEAGAAASFSRAGDRGSQVRYRTGRNWTTSKTSAGRSLPARSTAVHVGPAADGEWDDGGMVDIAVSREGPRVFVRWELLLAPAIAEH